MGVENINKGIRFDKLGVVRLYGATSSVANLDLVKKPVSPLGTRRHICIKEGEGVYIEDNGVYTKGYHFPVAEAVFEAHAATEIIIRALSSTLVVACFVDGNDTYAKAIAGTVDAGGAITWGTAVNVNEALSDSLGLCKVSSATFAMTYRDNTGTTGYVCARMGSISGTTITLGDEVEITAAAADGYTDVCVARSGYLAIAYALSSDSHGDCVAIDYSTTTLGTPGTPAEFNGAGTSYIKIVSHTSGKCLVAYRDAGHSSYAYANVGTVSSAGVVTFAGSAAALNAVAATSINLRAVNATTVVATYIASTYVYLMAMAIATNTITAGTAVALNASASLTPDVEVIDQNVLLVVYEDDGAASDYATYALCSRSDANVVALVKAHVFAVGDNAYTTLTKLDDGRVVVAFSDGSDSDKGKAMCGYYCDHLIDVRSAAASKYYSLWLIPHIGRLRNA